VRCSTTTALQRHQCRLGKIVRGTVLSIREALQVSLKHRINAHRRRCTPAAESANSPCWAGIYRQILRQVPIAELATLASCTDRTAAGSGRAAANMTHHSMTRSARRRRDSCAACFAAAPTAMPTARGLRINITASCVGRSARGSGSSSTSCWTSCTESRVTSGSASTASSPACRGSCKIQRLGRPTCAYSQLAPSAQAASYRQLRSPLPT